jgi:hypothetical protein
VLTIGRKNAVKQEDIDVANRSGRAGKAEGKATGGE